MKVTERKKKQLLAMFPISALGALVLIVHGVILDLNMAQLSRITLGGFLVTLPAVFVGLLTLEWVFDLD
jgi:hypothetical protein